MTEIMPVRMYFSIPPISERKTRVLIQNPPAPSAPPIAPPMKSSKIGSPLHIHWSTDSGSASQIDCPSMVRRGIGSNNL